MKMKSILFIVLSIVLTIIISACELGNIHNDRSDNNSQITKSGNSENSLNSIEENTSTEVSFENNDSEFYSEDVGIFNIELKIECDENLIFSRYNVSLYLDDDFVGTIEHGATEIYNLQLESGIHVIDVNNEEDSEVKGHIEFQVTADGMYEFELYCTREYVAVTDNTKYSDENSSDDEYGNTSNSTESLITVTMSEDDLKGLEKSDAEQKLRDMGFTVFRYDTLDAGDRADLHNKISSVEIKSWEFGKGDFSKGDTYDSNAIVVLWYYEYTEPEKSSPVFYSTNDYETAQQGNTGVFSYRSEGGSYYIYWIIDFEEGYVYYFVEGNGNETCDRLKIESGDLNSRITITYHDGDEVWSELLHFKYKNHPETLIYVDSDGFDYKFTTTDLDDALKLRDTKNITDY